MSAWAGYYLAKIKDNIFRTKYKHLNKWFKKKGIVFSGGGVNPPIICSNIAKNEPYLISIGDDTVISGDVHLLTHDYSISRLGNGMSDLFGKIDIGRNCFIGNGSTILYGVTICDNVIVADGSIVTKSIREERVIVAGNPARIISTWEKFEEKYKDIAWRPAQMSLNELKGKQINEGDYLVKK